MHCADPSNDESCSLASIEGSVFEFSQNTRNDATAWICPISLMFLPVGRRMDSIHNNDPLHSS